MNNLPSVNLSLIPSEALPGQMELTVELVTHDSERNVHYTERQSTYVYGIGPQDYTEDIALDCRNVAYLITRYLQQIITDNHEDGAWPALEMGLVAPWALRGEE